MAQDHKQQDEKGHNCKPKHLLALSIHRSTL